MSEQIKTNCNVLTFNSSFFLVRSRKFEPDLTPETLFSNLRLILWRILRHLRGFVFSSVRVWGLQEMQPKVMQQKIRERLWEKVKVKKTLDCSNMNLNDRFDFILDWTLKFIRKVCHNFSWCLTAPTLKSVELCSPSEEKKTLINCCSYSIQCCPG